MGRTVKELNATLDPNEFEEWKAFYEVAPWGTMADDQRAQASLALFYSAHAKEGSEIPVFFDRFPHETARRKRIEEEDLDPFEQLERLLQQRIAASA